MYHPYKSGYSVLPNLKKIERSNIFEATPDRLHYLAQKKLSLQSQKCVSLENLPPELHDEVCSLILGLYPIMIDPPYDLNNIAMQIQEDLVVHMMNNETDWMAAYHVCFPSNWSPEEKIGKSFKQIHDIIPGMNLSHHRKMVETMINNGPFERFLWGFIYENELNYHPDMHRKKFDIDDPKFFVRVERQITLPIPEHKATLFILRQFILNENECDHASLLKGIYQMTSAQRKYKGITDDLISHLQHTEAADSGTSLFHLSSEDQIGS